MRAQRPLQAGGRFQALSGFRFLLAAHILVFHFAPAPAGPGLLTRFLSRGYVATSALFVLSGFLLANVHPEPLRQDEQRQFWMARLARLYPAYLVAWALSLAAFIATASTSSGGEAARPLAGALLSLALVQAWSPQLAQAWNSAGWATSAAVFFYAVFPFALSRLARASNRALLGYAAAFWVASLLAPSLLLAASPRAWVLTPASSGFATNLLKYDPALRLPEFLFGCAVGLLYERRALRGNGLLVLAGLACLYLPTVVGDLPYALLHNGLLAPAVALVLVGLASGEGLLARVLATRPLVTLGEAGFAIYVLQFPLHGLAGHVAARARYDASAGPAFGVFAVATIAAGFAVSRWLELPIRRAVRRAREHEGAAAPPGPSTAAT